MNSAAPLLFLFFCTNTFLLKREKTNLKLDNWCSGRNSVNWHQSLWCTWPLLHGKALVRHQTWKLSLKTFHMSIKARLTGQSSSQLSTNGLGAGARERSKVTHPCRWLWFTDALGNLEIDRGVTLSLEGAFYCRFFVCVPAALSGIPSDQSSGTSSPLCDSGLHLNYHPNNTVLF